jgi:hypothetical protein
MIPPGMHQDRVTTSKYDGDSWSELHQDMNKCTLNDKTIVQGLHTKYRHFEHHCQQQLKLHVWPL